MTIQCCHALVCSLLDLALSPEKRSQASTRQHVAYGHVASQLLANLAPPAHGQLTWKKLYDLSVRVHDELGMCGGSVASPEHPVHAPLDSLSIQQC